MDKEKLQKALEYVKPGLANKDVIEQATSFAFMGDRVVTYNDEISISHPIEEGYDIKGAVKAEELYQLLNKTKQKEIDIVCSDNEIQITTKNSKAGLALQNEIILPLEEMGTIDNFKKLPEEFMEMLDFVSFACSNDYSRPVLTCVHIRKDGVLEASDGFRVTQSKTKKGIVNQNTLFPSVVIKTLSKYPIKSIAESPGWLHFKTEEDTRISSRIFSTEYPDIEKMGILEIENGVELVFPDNLPEILERAAIFTKDAVFDSEKEVTVVLKKNLLIVQGKSEYGWFEEETDIEYEGEEIVFKTHPEFLRDISKKMTKCLLGTDKIKFAGENWEHVLALKT